MMKIANMVSSLSVAGVVLCASAVAQTQFCMGGDLAHLSQAQKNACGAKLQAVRSVATALHAPQDWHFVVVCGEEGWKQYTAYTMREDRALMNAVADTNFEEHETFLRESRLGQDSVAALQSTLAHEVAGILAHNAQEARADVTPVRTASGS